MANTSPSFKTVIVSGQTDVVADASDDTLRFIEGGAVTITTSGVDDSVTVAHSDTSSQADVDNSGQAFIQDLTFDTYGHVTGVTSATASGGGGGGGITTGKAIAMAMIFG